MSVVYSQSELLQKEVFLVELIDSISKSKESMSHLKAVYFLRPTSENIQHMRRQLSNPRFGEYHLCKFFVSFKFWFYCENMHIVSLPILDVFLVVLFYFIVDFCSFLKHVEGYPNSSVSRFRWTGSCPASPGKSNILVLFFLTGSYV